MKIASKRFKKVAKAGRNELLGGALSHLVHPMAHALEGGALREVVDHADAVRATEIGRGEGREALLALENGLRSTENHEFSWFSPRVQCFF